MTVAIDTLPMCLVAILSVFAVLGSSLEDLLRRRFATFRTIYLPTAGELDEHGFELLATAQRPHFTIRLMRAGRAGVSWAPGMIGGRPARLRPG
jgi:hypothetical protein